MITILELLNKNLKLYISLTFRALYIRMLTGWHTFLFMFDITVN